MKIYIAGAITNNPDYMQQFKAAEERLKAAGHAVINPCKNDGFNYREYINIGLCKLMHCDAIYLLNGYESSTGAKLEYEYAIAVGLRIIKEQTRLEKFETLLKENGYGDLEFYDECNYPVCYGGGCDACKVWWNEVIK